MGVSAVGTWLQLVAQDWLVLDITGNSGSALGITTALQFLPLLLFGMWGGVIADRYTKRRVLMMTQTTMGVLALVLGALTATGAVRIWHVYALAFALGLVKVIDNPTLQSLVVELVGPEDRVNAIALDGAARASARIVGPAIAGLLINAFGIGIAFLINGFSFTLVILGLTLMRDDELYAAPRTSKMKGQLRAVLTYMRGRGDLVLVLVLVGFVAAFGMNQQITTALMTKNVFHAGAGSYGLASTALAVGALAGSLLAARTRHPTRRRMLGTAFMFGAVEAVAALTPSYTSFLLLMPATGLVLVLFTNSAVVTLQLEVTPEMRGRISGLYYLLFTGTTPIGAPLIGWFAQVLGARAGLLAGGLAATLATVAVAPLLIRHGQARVAQPVRAARS